MNALRYQQNQKKKRDNRHHDDTRAYYPFVLGPPLLLFFFPPMRSPRLLSGSGAFPSVVGRFIPVAVTNAQRHVRFYRTGRRNFVPVGIIVEKYPSTTLQMSFTGAAC